MEEPLIMDRILSFLPAKEAAKTSILSKAWLEAWRTRSTLEFSHTDFFPADLYFTLFLTTSPEQPKKIRKFCRYISTTLQRYSDRRISITKLKLKLGLLDISESLIQEYIRIAFQNKVRTLHLYLSSNVRAEIAFRGKSIVNISLHDCSLRTLSVHQIRCRNIKTLNVDMVSMDELMFENIIRSCPLLKVLGIARIDGRIAAGSESEEDENIVHDHADGNGFYLFRIDKHANLRLIHVEFLKHQSVILGELPRLDSLVCTTELESVWEEDDGWVPSGFSLHSSRYQNMNTLVLKAVGIGDKFFDNFACMFPNVKDLSIHSCRNLQIVKLSSGSIERIKLVDNEGLKEAHFDLVKMAHFEYWDDEGGEIPLLSFTPVSGHWVSFLYIRWGYEVAKSWLLKLKELLSYVVQSEISLTVSLRKIPAFNMDEIREIFASSKPIMVEELSIDFSYHKEPTILSILDGLFWIFRPGIICQHLPDMADIHSIKFLYKILVLKRNHDQISFWQSDLKDVQVGTCTYKGFGNRFRQRRTCELLEMGDNVKDVQGFLDVARTIVGVGGICFKFEWITSADKFSSVAFSALSVPGFVEQ